MENKEYIIGSVLLGLNNNRDTDKLILTDVDGEYRRVVEDSVEKLYISKELLESRLNFTCKIEKELVYLVFNYQLDSQIIGQDFPIQYNVLEHYSELLYVIGQVILKGLFNFNKRICVNGKCSKLVYHIAYNIFILQNDSPILTNEQKEIIQKIHDEEMPISYLDVLVEIYKNIIPF